MGGLRAEHIGLFWSEIYKKFPKSQNVTPINPADILTLGGDDVFPLPRFWFISEDDSTLIQIQRNALLFNWRKKKERYPHYENVKKEFDDNFRHFEDFLERVVGIEKIYIERCELTYINVIGTSEIYQGVGDIQKIIPSISFPETGLKPLEGVNFKTSYKATDNIQLTITVQNRIPLEEGKKGQEILYYELRANGKLPESNIREADKFFEASHDIIGECFLTMVSEEAKQFWDRKDPS